MDSGCTPQDLDGSGRAGHDRDFGSLGRRILSSGSGLIVLPFCIPHANRRLICINDYYDFRKGLDDEKRLGPKRACAEGWISLPAMRRGIICTTLLSCLTGLPLVWYGGWTMVLVGVCCVVFCFLYTTCMARLGLGDLLVLVFFGLVPVGATYYLQSGTVVPEVWALSLACGLVIDCLLVVNNYRDRYNDKVGGKITLVYE